MIQSPGENSGRTLVVEQTYTIETPEHVDLVYTVAGPGTRLLAFVIDTLVMLLPVLMLIALAMTALAIASREWVDDILGQRNPAGDSLLIWMALAALTMGLFVVSNFYFVFFELLWNGQSPGKLAMRIRVMRDSGKPVGLAASLIRNLIRIADSLPLFYAAGFVAMLASSNWRRLGDLAAGTIVVKIDDGRPAGARAAAGVHEPSPSDGRGVRPPDTGLARQLDEAGIGRLDPAFFDLVSRWVERREEISPAAVRQIAEKIARPAMERLGIVGIDPETFLTQVHAARTERASAGGPSAP